jgi:hypothetical protein
MSRRHRAEGLSVKSERLLDELGVRRAFEGGAALVPVGPTYRLADDRRARLAFSRDEEGRVCVGYAVAAGPGWAQAEAEVYSARALGYYQRRLRRIGQAEDPGRAG